MAKAGLGSGSLHRAYGCAFAGEISDQKERESTSMCEKQILSDVSEKVILLENANSRLYHLRKCISKVRVFNLC